jgi:predicted ATPase
MITKLVVSNYRSLGPGVHFQPGRLSFFIGQNGSGKSNILDALSFVRDAVKHGLPAAIANRNGIDSVRRRSQGRPFDVHIEIELTIDQSPYKYGYSFVLTGDRLEEYRVKSEWAVVHDQTKGSEEFRRNGNSLSGLKGVEPNLDEQSLALTALGGTKKFKPLVDFLSDITVYSIFPDTLRVPQSFDSSRPLKEHGENWVSILRDLIKQADIKQDMIEGLHKLTGDIDDVKVSRAAGYLIAEFRQQAKSTKEKRWFNAAQQSDGTLRVAGLLTALLQTPPLPVIGIEEPELTVHPGALTMIYDYLQQASEVSQIFVTTHSPVILDVIDVEKDSIFVVSRAKGKTDIQRMTDAQLKPVRDSLLRLGDLFIAGDLQQALF